MSYCKASAVVEAAPETIWETCFAPMRWESWDHNIRKVKDASGPCQNGTTCVFEQKDGKDFLFALSDVTVNRSLRFSGAALAGTIRAEGKISIAPIDSVLTKVDYNFELTGSVGFAVAFLRRRAVVEGTESGLANIARLSEAAQEKEIVNMN